MRLIDADAVLDGIEELKKSPWATDKRGNGFEYLITEALDVVADLCVKQAPSVNPQEPCDDAISRQAVLNIIEAESWVYIDYLQKDIGGNYDCHISMYTDNIRWRINEMPSVTPTQKCVENALGALDLISRQAALDLISKFILEIHTEGGRDLNAHTNDVLRQILRNVKSDRVLPPVNPQEPKTIQETPTDSVIEDIKAEMQSCIGAYYMIGEREYRDGTKFINCGHYDTGTIEQMIQIIDKYKAESEVQE